jgi:hypothetical protein
VIVGAGLMGLSAAIALNRAGHDLLVLEARDRVGGRTHSAPIGGGGGGPGRRSVDWGAEWILPLLHPRMAALAERHGIALVDAYGGPEILWDVPGLQCEATYDVSVSPCLSLCHRGRTLPLVEMMNRSNGRRPSSHFFSFTTYHDPPPLTGSASRSPELRRGPLRPAGLVPYRTRQGGRRGPHVTGRAPQLAC